MAFLRSIASGHKIPSVGLGTWKIPRDVAAETVLNAIKAGYRHIDCASDYGNEAEVGAGIRAAIEAGIVARGDLWITSKLWNTNHAKEHVRLNCERSLSDLGVSYLDLYLIHFPIAFEFVPFDKQYPGGCPKSLTGETIVAKVPLRETWEAMEALHAAGVVKNIGVSNFNSQLLYDLLSYCKVPPAVNQVELHPYLAQQRLVAFCHANSITVTAFSSFGSPSYVELGVAAAISGPTPLLMHATVTAIATAHKKTPAQVLLRWAVQQEIMQVENT